MEKTIKQIADEIGISKQKVYRYIQKSGIKEARQEGQVKWYDEAAQTQIKKHFSDKKPESRTNHHNINETVLKQLEVKDKQIEALQKQLSDMQTLLDQEQKLHMIAEQKILAIEEKQQAENSKNWLQRFFKA